MTTFKPRPECKTCNCQSEKIGCTWPVLNSPQQCRFENADGRRDVGFGKNFKSPHSPQENGQCVRGDNN